MPNRRFGRFAGSVIRKRLARILDEGTVAFARGRADDLHGLRIAVKRLRYNVEFAASLAPEGAAVALDLLARLQERLGTLADLDAFARTYDALLETLGPNHSARKGLEALRDGARRDRARALDEARAYWLGDPPYPERLAASISAMFASGSPKPEP